MPKSQVVPRAFLLDMDGVLFHGKKPLPGAGDFLNSIAHLPHIFLTNNPILTPSEIVRKLVDMGLPRPEPEQVITSAQATATWLSTQKRGFRYFAVGAPGLHHALAECGVEDSKHADYVVIGEGPGLDYDSLTLGINLIIQQGSILVATNPDQTVDDVRDNRHLILPGGGALVAAFSAATGQVPIIIGKPNALLFEMALQRLGVNAYECMMVGDRPDTDIGGAAKLNIQTALVRTGRFQPDEPWPQAIPRPDWDAVDLDSLRLQLDRQYPGLLR